MVVDLHPLDLADGRHPDEGAAVGEFLVTVFVVQRGIPAPGRLEGIGEGGRRGRIDERGADVLAVRLRGVHQLGDPGQAAVRAGDHLHLLVGEALDVVHGEHDAGLAKVPGRAEQRLLDRDGVHGVPVDQQRARREMLAGQPERIGVVPLLGPVVVDQGQPDAVPGLQRGHPVPDRAGRVADHDGDVAQTDRSQIAQGDVEDGDGAALASTGDRQQGLGQPVRVRSQPPARACRQDHSDQALSPSASSGLAGTSHTVRKSQMNSNQR